MRERRRIRVWRGGRKREAMLEMWEESNGLSQWRLSGLSEVGCLSSWFL